MEDNNEKILEEQKMTNQLMTINIQMLEKIFDEIKQFARNK